MRPSSAKLSFAIKTDEVTYIKKYFFAWIVNLVVLNVLTQVKWKWIPLRIWTMFLSYWSTNLNTLRWISISISACSSQNSSTSTFGLLNVNLILGICDWPPFVNSHSTLELWTVYGHVKLVCKGEFDLKVAHKWNQNTTVLDQTCHPSRCHMWKFCGGNGISLY